MKLITTFILLLSTLVIPQAAQAGTPKPNVVIIMLDDGRKDQIVNMPNVQSQLVNKGVTFDQSIIADPLCCPSRASYLRGQYAHTTSVFNVQFEYGGRAQYLEADIEDEMLNVWFDPTHYTALIGKYTNGYNTIPAPGPAGSWDFVRAFNQVGYNNPDWTVTDGTTRTTPNQYSTDYMTDQAVSAIQGAGSEPVFAYVNYYAPHSPFIPPARYDTAAETPECDGVDLTGIVSFNEAGKQPNTVPTGLLDKPRWLKDKPSYTTSQRTTHGITNPKLQCRTLLAVDDGVDSIIAALQVKDPGLDNTIVVLTSDQGVQNGQHNWINKQVPYEETVNVPLVVRADGFTGEVTSTETQMVSNIDLAPTLLDLANLPQATPGCPQTGDIYQTRCEDLGRGGFDGYSYGPLIRGGAYSARSTLLIEHWDPATGGKVPTFCTVRTPTTKLTRYVQDGTGSADWEGYNLASDPLETKNIVFSDQDGVPQFRSSGGLNGQTLYNDLIDDLQALCDPRPPGYPAW